MILPKQEPEAKVDAEAKKQDFPASRHDIDNQRSRNVEHESFHRHALEHHAARAGDEADMLVLSCFVIAMLKDRELSSEARRTLLGSFVHVANLQLAGELTTRAHISESCETHINTIKLALGQLVEFEILDLEKTQSSMGYKTASYSVAQSLLAAARAPA